jgi:Type IV secretion system pilin
MKFLLSLVIFAGLSVSLSAHAQGNFLGGGEGGELGSAMETILDFIDGIVIPFILSIGFLVFVWGMFKYFIQGGANDEAKESGKSLIMYAIAGYVVILAFWGIVNILSNGLGLEDTLDSTPQVQVQ